MTQVSILLVDDHPVVREGYRRLLERCPQFTVCAEAEDVTQAYLAYKSHKPDVVIMDLTLQGASGLEAGAVSANGTGRHAYLSSRCIRGRPSR